ncbi:MAG: hypothetical protein ABI472_20395 [Ginsengibacter sp.]
MIYLLFAFYLLVLCWLITRIKFFKESGLDNRVLIFLFLIRVIAGIINGYINLYYYHGTDVANFQQQGIEEYQLLFRNTTEYFTNIFQSNHTNSYGGFLESSDSYWNDTRSNLIIKMLSVFNIFSRMNYFINSLFYNFLIFFGTVALYKVYIRMFPFYKFVLIGCIFLLPSLVFFSSSVHRDGLVFLSLSMVIYHLFFMMRPKHFSWKKVSIVLLFLGLILLLRNFVFIALLPALIALIAAEQKPTYAFIIFSGIYIFIAISFFCSGLLPAAFNLPAHVSIRQIAFIEIAKRGASAININPLYPNFRSFFNNIPQAINHSLMRPYLTEHLTFIYIPAGLEILLYEILFFLFIFFRKKNEIFSPLIYFSLFFCMTMFLIIGYTIPIIGAIARYRSIYFPFLLIPLICYTDWSRLKKTFI